MRIAKIVLVVMLAFLGMSGLLNLANWDGGRSMVEAITSMSGIPEPERPSWATANRMITILGIAFIAFGKISAGVCCAVGATRMWRARDASADAFQSAKTWALIGAAIFLTLFFGGFMYVAGIYFMGWRTELGTMSADWAFTLGASVALTTLLVLQRDP